MWRTNRWKKIGEVCAINAKQVSVTFSKDVNVDDLEKTNFDVTQDGDAAGLDRLTDSASSTNNVTGATKNTGKITAGSDAKTVILTMDNGAKFTNGKTITVKVEDIKDGEKTMATVTKTAVLSDTEVPTVVKAESKASNEIRVLFNEPVYNGTNDDYTTDFKANNFTVNDGAVAITSAVRDASNPNAVIITTGADLTVGSEYTVKVNPVTAGTVQDYAGYEVMEKTTVKFTHTAESAAPAVTAEAKTESKIRLKFERSVTIPVNANIEFRYGYNAAGANKVVANNSVGTVSAVANSNGKEYDITFPAPLSVGAGTIYVNYTDPADSTKSNVIKDGFGNVVADDTAIAVNVVSDTTAPTATVEYKDKTNLDVFFSEDVTGADVANNYEVKDKDGKIVAISGVALIDADKDQYRLTVADMSAGGNYTVKITDNIKDMSVNQNKFATQTFTVAVPDTVRPSVNGVAPNSATNVDKLYVYYSEEMGASAVDVANYRLVSGSTQYSLPSGTSITQTGSTVTISLPKTLTAIATDLGSGAIDKLFVGAVADKAGNQLASMVDKAISAYSANFTATISSEKLLSDKQVSFKVDRQLKSVDATKIAKNGGAAATSASFVNNTDGTATVTANFATDTFGTDPTGTAIDVNAGALTDLSDFTNNAKTNEAIASDYAAPKIVSNTTKDVNLVNGKIDTIDVLFSEDLYPGSVQESDFTVEGYTVTGVSVAGSPSTVSISVMEKGSSDTGATPKVTLVGEVEDNVTVTVDQPTRNKLTAQSANTAIDGAASLISSAATTQTAATGTVTINGAIADDEIVTLGGRKYGFDSAGDGCAGVDVVITTTDGTTDLDTAKNNAQAALVYAVANDASATVTLGAFTADVATVTAKGAANNGAFGNTLTLAKTGANTSVSGANLSGGKDVVVVNFSEAINTTTIDITNLTTDFAITGVTATGTTAVNSTTQVTLTVNTADVQVKGKTIGAKTDQIKGVDTLSVSDSVKPVIN